MTGRLFTFSCALAFFNIIIFGLLPHSYASMSAQAKANGPKEVDVMIPRQVSSEKVLSLSGSVEARQRAQISALESGTVSSLNVEIGDVVEKGQVLLELDNSLVKLSVAAAQASFRAAKVNKTEAQRLYKEVLALSENQVVAQTFISERAASLSTAEAALAREEANLSLQQALLARHSLQAPFSGVISMRSAEIGEWLSVQQAAFELVNTNDLRLNLSIAQEYYQDFIQSDDIKVSITPDSGGLAINTSISRLVPVSNSMNRSFLAQVDLPVNSGLIAGMSARADIQLGNTGATEIKLPRSAVKQHPDGGSSVFIAQNGKAKRIVTRYRNLAHGNVAIKLDDQRLYNNPFVISGVELLKDGDKINTTEMSNGLSND